MVVMKDCYDLKNYSLFVIWCAKMTQQTNTWREIKNSRKHLHSTLLNNRYCFEHFTYIHLILVIALQVRDCFYSLFHRCENLVTCQRSPIKMVENPISASLVSASVLSANALYLQVCIKTPLTEWWLSLTRTHNATPHSLVST